MDVEPTRAVRYILDGKASCVAEARRHVSTFLAAAKPPADAGAVDSAELAVSELVSNAVQHAPGPCVLLLSDDGRYLRIEVSDSSVQLPVERDADLYEGNGGAGLRLLRAVAAEFEVCVDSTGKTVSVTLDRSPHQPHS